MWKKIVSAFLIFSIFSLSIFSADNTPEKYDTSELPQSLQDLRRFEIITLGSMPFVMLDTTLAYSAIMNVSGKTNAKGEPYKITPFASNSSFSWEEDQVKIIAISAGVCVGIGLTDLIVRLVKRSSKNKKAMRTTSRDISVTPISEDPDAVHIRPPENPDEVEIITDISDVVDIVEDVIETDDNDVLEVMEVDGE